LSQAKRFGRYNLVRKVAQGGMAEIFLAKFQGIGGFEKKIIIKRILPRFSENQEFIKMLIHEAKTAVQLHHQNIVQIYDLGKVRDTYFISMEYIRGKDLRTVLNRLKSQGQTMPEELAVFIAREVCKGLDYAHHITDQNGEPLNLVHRDISPPNILLSLEGEVKIIDFGIAKATSQATDTQAGVFKGKFAYMAPEQATGLPVDRRSDIFAIGLILWEMLTCQKLLEAESDVLTLERAKRIDSYNPPFEEYGIPEQLEHIIRKAIKQDREARYQTAGEIARDLTVYLNLKYPGFSETDLADFLRVLFNLDRRRGSSGDMVTHGQGERSLTGSDFFKALDNVGRDQTDPSLKLRQAAAKAGEQPAPQAAGDAPSAPGQRPGAPPGTDGAPAHPPAAPGAVVQGAEPRKRDGRYWALENDLSDELEVFPGGDGAQGASQGGWVSQVAVDFIPGEDGSLHPLISGALSGDPAGRTAGTGPGGALRYSPEATPALAAASGATEATLEHAGVTKAEADQRRGPGPAVWILGGLAFLLALATAASIFYPSQVTALKERLGLIKKVPVVLNYQPEDAQILVNGTPWAASGSPATIELTAGQRHQIEIRKEGYEARLVPVDLVTNESVAPIEVRLAAMLPRGDGKLKIEGLLPGAIVYINDWPTVPEQWEALPTGVPLTVRVVKEHYLPFETQVTLGDDPLPLRVTLQPEPVDLTVESTPANATVYVDGVKVGTTPYRGEGFEPGKVYKVEVTAPGYKPYATIVSPQAGSPYSLKVVLASQGVLQPSRPVATTRSRPKESPRTSPPAETTRTSKTAAAESDTGDSGEVSVPPVKPRPRGIVQVQIFVNPWAEVYIDGRYVGRTPVTVPVKTGRHTIRLVNKELDIDFVDTKDIKPPPFGETQSFRYDMG